MSDNHGAVREEEPQTSQKAALSGPNGLPWLFLDLDSTLIPPGKEISRRNTDAIHAYTEAGGRVSLATGRHPLAIRPLVKLLHLDTPHLAGNGSVVSEDGHCSLLFGIADRAESATRILLERRIPHVHYTVAGLYILSPEVDEHHVDLLVSVFHDYQPVRTAPPDPEAMFKILCFVDINDGVLDAKVREIGETVGLKSVRTSHLFLELVSPDCGKGAALALLADRAGWPLSKTLAVGDSENDLSMLERAGRAVAVANAVPEVLRAADEVVASCKEDGVAQLIESLLKGEER